MSLLVNTHTHTVYSGHGSGTVMEHAKAAADAGLDVYAFTEHMVLPKEIDPTNEFSIPADKVESYFQEIEEARAAFPQVEFITGFEADWYEGCEKNVEKWRQGTTFLIGSLHFLHGWEFDHPGLVHEWDNKNVDDVYREYFDEWLRAAQSSLSFDVMGHPDLIKKFGHRPSFDLYKFYQHYAQEIAKTGVRIEVNSAGLRYPAQEVYPGPEFLRAFAEAGVPTTISTDSHHTKHVVAGLKEAYQAARDAGYTSIDVPKAGGGWRTVSL